MAVAFVSLYVCSHVRLYRDCSAADLAFAAVLTVLAAYAASHARSSRSSSRSSRPTRRASAPPSRSSQACSSSPSSTCTSLPPRRLHAPRRRCTGRDHNGECDAPLPPNMRAADVVYAPVHAPAGSALERSVEVWVEADAGCSTRAPHPLISVSLRLPPSSACTSSSPSPRTTRTPSPAPRALPQRGVRLLPLPPNARAADVVYVLVHAPAGSALERSAAVWVRAPPAPALEVDVGLLDAREWI
ncbi:hypothetical protein FB451DRAFT_1562529 [Mycena latifolia]|nr:hypothetical protein FB451DRAFT_1562529 [Mycena latifolia]